MLHSLDRLIRPLKDGFTPLWAGWRQITQHGSLRHTAAQPLPPDWQTPAYLRRRVSGDALACPWPPRQH